LFNIGGYKIYFWSNENNESIHVHINKGKPSPGATKVWLTIKGGCIVANNSSKIPASDLHELLEIIAAQSTTICAAWKQHFILDEIKFYC